MGLEVAGGRHHDGWAAEVRLGAGSAQALVSLHQRATDVLLGPADVAPGRVDAGDADEVVARLLRGLAEDGDRVAEVHALVAVLVRVAERHLDAADRTVAGTLLDLRSAA
ncbi:hypothetical protein [Nocardioides sp. SYSU DS0663]|uniref:hypothetical protein n=1 Tax=Nocardioides sp. SYSU DS0663 TaxID=3416445 RepID=UPI003F4C5C10